MKEELLLTILFLGFLFLDVSLDEPLAGAIAAVAAAASNAVFPSPKAGAAALLLLSLDVREAWPLLNSAEDRSS